MGTLATASTGAAISGLSGAAATNATLAWLGGGALSAGGFGIAGGTLALGGIVLGPALAIGGFMMAGGHVAALLQPNELVIIFGAGTGAFLAANGGAPLRATMKALPQLFKGDKYNKALYMELFALLFEVLTKVRKEGLMSIEADVENPEASPVFTMIEGGSAYLLLQEVDRSTTSSKPAEPSIFGNTMTAMLLIKTDALLPRLDQSLATNTLAYSATMNNAASGEKRLFSQSAPPSGTLDQWLLPNLKRQVQIDSASQTTHMQFEQRLAVPLRELVQHAPARRIGQGGVSPVQHLIFNHLVDYSDGSCSAGIQTFNKIV